MLYAYILSGEKKEAGGGIYSFAVSGDGKLTPASYLALPCAMYAAVSDGDIYVVCRGTGDGLDRFGRKADSAVTRVPLLESGRFGEPSPFYPTEGVTGCHIDILKEPGGVKRLFTANYSSALISRLSPDGDGFRCDAAVVHAAPDETHGRFDRRAYLHQSCLSPDGRFVAAVDLGRDEVVVYDTGLGFVSACRLAPGTGPRHIIFNGGDAYTVNELTSTVSRYKWDAGAGKLTFIENYDLLPEGSTAEYRLACSGAAIRVCDGNLYASVRLDESVTVFRINGDGSLTWLQYVKCGGSWPRDINLTPDGRYLYSANERENTVTAFSRSYDGRLSAMGAQASVPAPNDIVFAGV